MRKCGMALVAGFLFICAVPAQAAIVITFYSHKLKMFDGGYIDYPHGFVTLKGTTAAGQVVDINYGFTAPDLPMNALWEPVTGALDIVDAKYLAESQAHFSLPLTDSQYGAVLALVRKWRDYPQPSYDLDKHNCVTFVKEMAITVGLSVSSDRVFMRKPEEFLADVATRNATAIAHAAIPRGTAAVLR